MAFNPNVERWRQVDGECRHDGELLVRDSVSRQCAERNIMMQMNLMMSCSGCVHTGVCRHLVTHTGGRGCLTVSVDGSKGTVHPCCSC